MKFKNKKTKKALIIALASVAMVLMVALSIFLPNTELFRGDLSDTGGVSFRGANSQSCAVLGQWLGEGTLTPNMEMLNIRSYVFRQCETRYSNLLFGHPTGKDCRLMKYWLDRYGAGTLTRKMTSHRPPYTGENVTYCIDNVLGNDAWNTNLREYSTDTCKILRSWLDEGHLTTSRKEAKVPRSVLSKCSNSSVWYQSNKEEITYASTNNCTILKQWLDEGSLTSAMHAGRVSQSVVSECVGRYGSIWFDMPSYEDCKLMKYWLDTYNTSGLSGRMRVRRPPFTADDAEYCAYNVIGRQFWDVRLRGATDSSCQILRDWLFGGEDMTAKMREFQIPFDNAIACERSHKNVWYRGSPSNLNVFSEETCRTLIQWKNEGVLTPNRIANGISNNIQHQCSSGNYHALWHGHPSLDQCKTLKSWQDYYGASELSRRMQSYSPSPLTGENLQYCVNTYYDYGSWNADFSTPNYQVCQVLRNWLFQPQGVTSKLQMLGLPTSYVQECAWVWQN